MGHLVANSFSSYQLTEEEMLIGSLLTVTQKELIQTRLSSIAEEKLALEVDPNNIMDFVQKEAGLAGQLAALNWLLDCSEAAEAQQQEKNYPTQV